MDPVAVRWKKGNYASQKVLDAKCDLYRFGSSDALKVVVKDNHNRLLDELHFPTDCNWTTRVYNHYPDDAGDPKSSKTIIVSFLWTNSADENALEYIELNLDNKDKEESGKTFVYLDTIHKEGMRIRSTEKELKKMMVGCLEQQL